MAYSDFVIASVHDNQYNENYIAVAYKPSWMYSDEFDYSHNHDPEILALFHPLELDLIDVEEGYYARPMSSYYRDIVPIMAQMVAMGFDHDPSFQSFMDTDPDGVAHNNDDYFVDDDLPWSNDDDVLSGNYDPYVTRPDENGVAYINLVGTSISESNISREMHGHDDYSTTIEHDENDHGLPEYMNPIRMYAAELSVPDPFEVGDF